jgi:protein tyrosine phosphatase (PTP) superfamily phosphohydrolase (DUF442 family)
MVWELDKMNIEPLSADQKSIGLPGTPDCADRKLPADGSNNRTHRVHIYWSYLAIVTSLNRFLRTHRVGRFIACVVGVLLIGVGLAGAWAIGLQIVGNVHVVEDGIVYRSAQLNGQKLAKMVDAYGIKSVINLRGENRGSWWYDDEIEVTAARGVSHFDVRMSAVRDTDDATVTLLMETLRTAPRPLLIHCESGSDRTGLAAALYERFLKEQPAELAAGQISFRYGHFPWLGNRTAAMDRTYWRLSADGLPKS